MTQQDGVRSSYHYHCDPNGAPVRLTDVQGGLVWSEQCGVWGEPGVHYNRYRYYDPLTGSYISQDPIRLEGGINLYAYAPNPLGWFDPLGLSYSPKFNPQKKFKYKESKEIRLNLVYITYDFSSRCVLIEYYAEDNEYPDVEMKFDDLIDFVKK